MTEVSATHTDTTPQRCTQSEIFRDYCVETHQALPVSTMNSTIIGSVRTTEARKRILSLSIKYIIFLPSILPKPCAISSFLCSTLHAVIKKKKNFECRCGFVVLFPPVQYLLLIFPFSLALCTLLLKDFALLFYSMLSRERKPNNESDMHCGRGRGMVEKKSGTKVFV